MICIGFVVSSILQIHSIHPGPLKSPCALVTGGPSPRSRYATPPPPFRALRAHLVTKGQWLLTIHMVAPKAPEKNFFIPLAHVASLPAQAVEHPNAILEPNLDSNAHPNPQPAPNPTPNPTHDPNPNPNQE